MVEIMTAALGAGIKTLLTLIPLSRREFPIVAEKAMEAGVAACWCRRRGACRWARRIRWHCACSALRSRRRSATSCRDSLAPGGSNSIAHRSAQSRLTENRSIEVDPIEREGNAIQAWAISHRLASARGEKGQQQRSFRSSLSYSPYSWTAELS